MFQELPVQGRGDIGTRHQSAMTGQIRTLLMSAVAQ
jgi:hypothetical protein